MSAINSNYFPSVSSLLGSGNSGTTSGKKSTKLDLSGLGGSGSSDLSGAGGGLEGMEKGLASAFAEALVNVLEQNPQLASGLLKALGGADPTPSSSSSGGGSSVSPSSSSSGGSSVSPSSSSVSPSSSSGGGSSVSPSSSSGGGSSVSPSSSGGGSSVSPSSSSGSSVSPSDSGGSSESTSAPTSPGTHEAEMPDDAGVGGANGTSGSTERTKDGYTVDACVKDMQKLQSQNKMDGGGPQRSPTELRKIAKGIIKGINDNFPNQPGPKMAHALIASAWSESRFDTNATNGGVFQCAPNRLQDYNKAHGTNYTSADLSVGSSGDPSKSIKIALWAMSHPSTEGLRSVGGLPIPTDPAKRALYLWNYNDSEINKYMKTTDYSQSLLGSS